MLRVVAAPTGYPVTLDEAKQHLRVDFDDEDALISSLAAAATLQAQAMTQRRFVTQTLEWVLPCWRSCIRLPVAPVAPSGFGSIKYIDWNTRQSVTLDPTQYVVQTRGETVDIIPAFGTIWPIVFEWASEPIVIRFDAGTDPDDVPENVKAAIKLMIGHYYENRSSVIVAAARGAVLEVPQSAEALLMAELW